MAEYFEVSIRDENFKVEVSPAEGNHRRFTVGSIPLSCTVRREGNWRSADVHYAVQAPIRIEVPSQELDNPGDYASVLSDDEMPSHAGFVLGQWVRQSSEA